MTNEPLSVMLDLETLGTNGNAPILSIGACEFSLDGDGVGRTFYKIVHLSASLKQGFEPDGDTFYWWIKQSTEARAALLPNLDVSINEMDCTSAIYDFSAWLRGALPPFEPIPTRIWGHGADFDPPILANFYRRLGFKEPWERRAVRDTRTLFELAELDVKAELKALNTLEHDALADAIAQARLVQKAWAKLHPVS